MKQKAILPVLTQIAQDEIPAVKGDTVKLIADLQAFLPVERLVTKPDDLFAYECDAQTFDRAVPLCVAFPETTAEVSRVIQLCCKHNVPFVPRGAGTGLSGGVVAVGSVVIATARLNKILEIDVPNRQAWVQPGVVNMHLSKAVAADGLHYAPDPSSQYACTIGGNVAENSGGPHTLKYGVTTNHILALEVVLPDGEVALRGGPAADAPGYDLVSAFVGSEGTFGIATKILVKLTPVPEGVKTVLAIFDTVGDACRAVTKILERGVTPAALELIDQTTLRAVEAWIHAGFPLDAAAVLLIEVDGLVEDLEPHRPRMTVPAEFRILFRDARVGRDRSVQKIVRMRALDAHAMDQLTGDVKEELDRMNGEIRTFEETLKSVAEVSKFLRSAS